jgi:hypothetical protein
VHYSFPLEKYIRYQSWDKKLYQTNVKPEERRSTVAHSTAIFSFTGTVTVRVTISPDAKHITLPLTSARVLPTSYDIPCHIENGNTIVFTLDRPEKVAVIANYDEVWKVFEEKGKGHVPIPNWDSDLKLESERADFQGDDIEDYLAEGFQKSFVRYGFAT